MYLPSYCVMLQIAVWDDPPPLGSQNVTIMVGGLLSNGAGSKYGVSENRSISFSVNTPPTSPVTTPPASLAINVALSWYNRRTNF